MNLPFKIIRNTETEQWRADTFWEKEPETISWIKQFSHSQNAHFIDVGANIGLYSLYAALLRPKMIVYSFEAQIESLGALCQNISINDFSNIIPVYMAVGDTNRLTIFSYNYNVSGTSSGFIHPVLPQHLSTNNVSDRKHWFRRMISEQTLDNLFASCWKALPEDRYPIYLKIDVDGAEEAVIKGAKELLNVVSELLIEVDITDQPAPENPIIKQLLNSGFKLHDLNYVSPHSRHRRKTENIKVENVILQKA